MADAENYYTVLGVAPDVSREAVIRAFGRVAGSLHPSKNPSAEAAQQLAAVTEAYRVLADPATRAAYDAALRAGGDGARALAEPIWRSSQSDAMTETMRSEIGVAKASAASAFGQGALFVGGGALVTWWTYSLASNGGYYVVFWGAIVFGAYRMLRAASAYLRLKNLERSI